MAASMSICHVRMPVVRGWRSVGTILVSIGMLRWRDGRLGRPAVPVLCVIHGLRRWPHAGIIGHVGDSRKRRAYHGCSGHGRDVGLLMHRRFWVHALLRSNVPEIRVAGGVIQPLGIRMRARVIADEMKMVPR